MKLKNLLIAITSLYFTNSFSQKCNYFSLEDLQNLCIMNTTQFKTIVEGKYYHLSSDKNDINYHQLSFGRPCYYSGIAKFKNSKTVQYNVEENNKQWFNELMSSIKSNKYKYIGEQSGNKNYDNEKFHLIIARTKNLEWYDYTVQIDLN